MTKIKTTCYALLTILGLAVYTRDLSQAIEASDPNNPVLTAERRAKIKGFAKLGPTEFTANPIPLAPHSTDKKRQPENDSSDAPVKSRKLKAKDVFDSKQPILFHEDFSASTLARWKLSRDDQYALPEIEAERIKIVSAPELGKNRKAARFTVERKPDSFRSEIALPHEEGFQERWYAARLFLPQDWVVDKTSGGDIVLQWHAIPGNWRATYPNLAISLNKEHWIIQQSYGSPQTKPERNRVRLDTPIQLGQWVSWVVHAKWSPKEDGQLQIWQDNKLVFERKGPNVYSSIGVEYTPYFKTGIYHPEWHITSEDKRRAFEAEQPQATKKVILATDIKIGDARATYKDVAPSELHNSKETEQRRVK